MGKVGRKANHFETAGGDTIVGLIHQKDGRWRVLATGQKFVAASEAEAIARYRQIQGQPTVGVPTIANMEQDAKGKIWLRSQTPDETFWPWLRELLTTRLQEVAEKTGLRGLASLDVHAIPAKAILLTELADLYYQKSESKQNTRGHVRSAVLKLASITGATTLDSLTTPALQKFRDEINASLAPAGAAAIFGKVKSALSFARKFGLDAGQIDAALSRMKVLYTQKAVSDAKPTPIDPDDFHKLLKVADQQWRAIFLLSLNTALYLEDVAALEWKDIDLKAGTLVGLRGKTSIRRVGMLWPETVKALRAIPHDTASPFVFVSRTGTRYRSDSLHRRYAIIRDAAKITVTFSSIRDGAYTIAARSCDDRTARMFAAHAAPGLMDSYVERNPELVKRAADAVHKAYAPFPAKAGKR